MVGLAELVDYTAQFLQVAAFADYAPNGLQVEGKTEVARLVSGVTASRALIESAIGIGADALLVHHGYFWKGEDPCVRGMKRARLKLLLEHDISLLAYHLPLDAHPDLGNNIQLARRLGLTVEGGFGTEHGPAIALYGRLPRPLTADEFGQHVLSALGRAPLYIAGGDHMIGRIGWCSGAAQSYIDQAAALNLDAYLSGEISEPTVHSAREQGVHFFAAGHHATEIFGVQALGEHLAQRFGVEHHFINIANPV